MRLKNQSLIRTQVYSSSKRVVEDFKPLGMQTVHSSNAFDSSENRPSRCNNTEGVS